MGRSLRQSGLTWTEVSDGTTPPRWDVGTDPEEYACFRTTNDSGLRHLMGRCYTSLTLLTTTHSMHIQGSEDVSENMHTRWRTCIGGVIAPSRPVLSNSTVLVSTGELFRKVPHFSLSVTYTFKVVKPVSVFIQVFSHCGIDTYVKARRDC